MTAYHRIKRQRRLAHLKELEQRLRLPRWVDWLASRVWKKTREN